MDDVVVVDIVHLHTLVAVIGLHHLECRRVDLDIAMVAILAIDKHRVALDEFPCIEWGRMLLGEIGVVIPILTLDQTNQVARCVAELKDVGRLPHNLVACRIGGIEHERIVEDLEIHRLRCRVGIVNGVTLGLEHHRLVVLIHPDALQQLLCLQIFLGGRRLCFSRGLVAARGKGEQCQTHGDYIYQLQFHRRSNQPQSSFFLICRCRDTQTHCRRVRWHHRCFVRR